MDKACWERDTRARVSSLRLYLLKVVGCLFLSSLQRCRAPHLHLPPEGFIRWGGIAWTRDREGPQAPLGSAKGTHCGFPKTQFLPMSGLPICGIPGVNGLTGTETVIQLFWEVEIGA